MDSYVMCPRCLEDFRAAVKSHARTFGNPVDVYKSFGVSLDVSLGDIDPGPLCEEHRAEAAEAGRDGAVTVAEGISD
jgi:hypothetical protein